MLKKNKKITGNNCVQESSAYLQKKKKKRIFNIGYKIFYNRK